MWKERLFHLAQTKSHAQPTLPWLHLFSVVSPLCRVGNPLSIPATLYLDYPGNRINISPDPLRQSGTLHHTGYARLEQIRVLPARDVTFTQHNIPLTYTLNFRTTISLPRPRCTIVIHKVYVHLLLIRRILIGRATDFHIENVFRVNWKLAIVWKCYTNTTRLLQKLYSIFPHSTNITIF
jgi:hypothetical protein